MKKKIILLLLIFSSFNLFAQNNTEVKGLNLKFMLVDLCYEIYQVNIDSINTFTKENYTKKNRAGHYKWIKDIYKEFTETQKKDLSIIMTYIHPWSVMKSTAQLNDTADFDSILTQIISVLENNDYKEACKRFYPEVYFKYIKDYLLKNNSIYSKKADLMNEEIKRDAFNVFDFMEKYSGIKFKNRSKSVFYYTLRPIGAMGFNTKDEKIALIQSTVSNYKYLFFTAFHEFSHELFQTFSKNSSFTNIAEKVIKNDSLMREQWETIGKNNYGNYAGWCEENLVDGFSKFLAYKLTDEKSNKRNYVYDIEFCDYLIKTNFSAKEIKLEDASIRFYKQLISANIDN